jgi:hypothetical protein
MYDSKRGEYIKTPVEVRLKEIARYNAGKYSASMSVWLESDEEEDAFHRYVKDFIVQMGRMCLVDPEYEFTETDAIAQASEEYIDDKVKKWEEEHKLLPKPVILVSGYKGVLDVGWKEPW